LKFLAALQRYHLASIPFENLALRNAQSRQDQISLDPQAVVDKVITCRRGGYCMEQNLFFAYMLRGLGFKVYSAGARVRKRENGVPVGNFIGWTHVVNIATLEPQQGRQRYMVDVGFGGDGPTKPLPLTDGGVARNLGTQEITLRDENIESNADPGQRLWVSKVKNHEGGFWKDCYCFTELEFLPQDFSAMSYFINNSPAS
jgi:arylamine N-acetyltransferase